MRKGRRATYIVLVIAISSAVGALSFDKTAYFIRQKANQTPRVSLPVPPRMSQVSLPLANQHTVAVILPRQNFKNNDPNQGKKKSPSAPTMQFEQTVHQPIFFVSKLSSSNAPFAPAPATVPVVKVERHILEPLKRTAQSRRFPHWN